MVETECIQSLFFIIQLLQPIERKINQRLLVSREVDEVKGDTQYWVPAISGRLLRCDEVHLHPFLGEDIRIVNYAIIGMVDLFHNYTDIYVEKRS